jgi:Zn-dependent peptidase ImmA (M78 family)
MPGNISISAAVLDWVMAQTRLEELPDSVKTQLFKWRNEDKKPTFNQIEKVSRATGIPLGYFFLQIPPKEELPLLEYRTINSTAHGTPSRNLVSTMHDMEQIQDWARNNAIEAGEPPLAFIGAGKKEGNAQALAAEMRGLMDIDQDWFTHFRTADDSFRKIRECISDAGVIVMMNGVVENNTHRALSIEEFRAFAMADQYAPLIFINSNDSVNGKLFSLLHEFAHLLLGEDSLFNDRCSTGTRVAKTEVLCNAAAAEVLVPDAIFRKAWKETAAENHLAHTIELLARRFKCGTTVIARRALDHDFISSRSYQKIAGIAVAQYNENCRRKKENAGGGDFYRTAASRIDRRFLMTLIASVEEGKTLYSDAFRLTNTNRSTFKTLTETVGGIR